MDPVGPKCNDPWQVAGVTGPLPLGGRRMERARRARGRSGGALPEGTVRMLLPGPGWSPPGEPTVFEVKGEQGPVGPAARPRARPRGTRSGSTRALDASVHRVPGAEAARRRRRLRPRTTQRSGQPGRCGGAGKWTSSRLWGMVASRDFPCERLRASDADARTYELCAHRGRFWRCRSSTRSRMRRFVRPFLAEDLEAGGRVPLAVSVRGVRVPRRGPRAAADAGS